MKKRIHIALLLFFVNFSFSQTNYYYYKGVKKDLVIDKSKVYIYTTNDFDKNTTNGLGFKDYTLKEENSIGNNRKMALLEFDITPNNIEYLQKVNALKQNPNVFYVGQFFATGNNSHSLGTSNYFYVKLKSINDYNILQQKCAEKNIQIIKQVPNMPKWYILSVNPQTLYSSLDYTNHFFESGLFEDVDPAFMFNFKNTCANDTNFGSLWGLNNTQHPNYDINACQAWNITEGNGVKIAVIDTGIDLVHNDLVSNIYPLSYDCETQTSPSFLRPQNLGYEHGTHVGGIVGAIKNNNLQVVGVAPQSQLMSISHSMIVNSNYSAQMASGISWAYQNGADVINNSWGDKGGFYYDDFHSAILENAIIEAMTLGRNGKGSIVVFATGNEGLWGEGLDYPAWFDDRILTVGASTINGRRASFSSYGITDPSNPKLDVVAPGENILSTFPNNSISSEGGTSMAAPHVSGIAALILSVNPTLTAQQVRDIIEQTAQKISGITPHNSGAYVYSTTADRPNGTWNNEMGYGLVDAYVAVQMAQQMCSGGLDLMVKDGVDDIGNEPNNITQYMWASTDIWIRNQNDGITNQVHQNPEYSPTTPNYAYVRVTNKSCVASTGNEVLKFYWAKAGSSLSWPDTWNGNSYFTQGPVMGHEVGQGTIPALQPGQETIVTIPFLVPNPVDYVFAGSDQWHFCVLARIEAANDPLTETNDLYTNVQNNNGIAWKNVTIVDVEANITHGTIAVGNPFNTPRTFFLELVKEDLETGKPIYEEAEVGVKMDDVLYNAWVRGGKEAQQLDATDDEKKKIVKGNNVIVDNIAFNAYETGFLTLDFSFLTKETTEKQKFKYHVIQKDALTGKIIGGETYEIKKKVRPTFDAEAPDKEADLNQAITINAIDINEPAVYNWYDSAGNLVYQGKELQIANAVAEKYKLEVIATTDGFKDYKEVEVTLKPSSLGTITPNPASTTAQVQYKLNGAGSAYLMVLGYYGSTGISNNYILDINSTETTLNISNYPNGFYTVALIVNGEITDAKTLIKQ